MTAPRHLHVIARRPAMGQGKTRLAADIGAVQALRWQRALLAHTSRMAVDPRWETHWHLMSGHGHALSLEGVEHRQCRGDLGTRIAMAMRVAGRSGHHLVIGTDCPGLTRRHLAQAFASLQRGAWVIGPATDGGFWLIGARAPLDALAGALVRWSTAHALADTVAALHHLGQPFRLDMLSDVDCGDDLRRSSIARATRGNSQACG